MELTISSLVEYSLSLVLIAFVFFPMSGLLLFLSKAAAKEQYTLVKPELLQKFALLCVSLGILSLLLLFFGLIWAGFWWLWDTLGADLTPGKLALFSLVLGPSPLLLAVIASGIARLIGGTLDASQARDCVVFGIDIGDVLYTMFMMHWFTMFTGGLAVMGLMASGIWALARLL